MNINMVTVVMLIVIMRSKFRDTGNWSMTNPMVVSDTVLAPWSISGLLCRPPGALVCKYVTIYAWIKITVDTLLILDGDFTNYHIKAVYNTT